MIRVVVTGVGLLTSIGNDKDTAWKNLIDCKSGIKKIAHEAGITNYSILNLGRDYLLVIKV